MPANDIAALRNAGGSDDEILQYLSEKSPQFAGNAQKLQQAGGNSKDILDYLSETGAGMGAPEAPKNTSVLQAAAEGGSSLLSGLGATLGMGAEDGSFRQDAGNLLMKGGKALHDPNYKRGYDSFSADSPSTYGHLARSAIENALPMAYDGLATAAGGIGGTLVGGPGVGTAVGGGLAGGLAHYSQVLGPAALEIAQKNGRDAPNKDDMIHAALAVLPETILNQIGLKGSGALAGKGEALLGKGLLDTVEGGFKKTVGEGVTETGKAIARDAVTGAAGDAAHQVAVGAGTDEGVTFDPSRTLEAAVTGAATGGIIRGGKAVKDGVRAGAVSRRMSDITPEEGALLAKSLKDTGANLDNVKNAPAALATVKTTLQDQLGFAQKELAGLGYKVGEERNLDTGELRGDTLSQASKALNKGLVVPEDHMKALEAQLGDSLEGQSALNTIRAFQAHNKLLAKGDLGTGGSGQGGLTRKASPLNILANALKGRFANVAAGGTSGVLGSIGAIQGTGGLAAVMSGAAPLTSTIGMGLLGAHGALRALDGVTGARNPTRELVRSFGSDKGAVTDPAARPSLTRAQQAAQEQAALDAARAKLEAEGTKTASKVDKVLNAKSKKLDSEEASQASAVAARSEQMDRESAAVERKKQKDLEKAFPKPATSALEKWQQRQVDARNVPVQIDPRRKAAQEEAMWAQQEAPAPKDSPDVDLQAQAAIKAAYKEREAESQAAVLPGMARRAALRKLKAQTDAAKAKEDAKAAAEAEKASNAGLPDSMAKTFKGQMRDIANRPEPKPVKEAPHPGLPESMAKTFKAQIKLALNKPEPKPVKEPEPQGLPASMASTLKGQMKAVLNKPVEKPPAPPKEEKPQGLNPAHAKHLKSAMDKIKAAQGKPAPKAPEKPQETQKQKAPDATGKAEKPASEAPKATADAPDIVHHLGVDIIVPKDVGNREAYINAAKKKQDNLYGHIADGANLDGVSIKTGDRLQDLETKIRASRSQKDAEVLLEQVYAHATKDERHILKAHFDNKKFYALWRK